MKKTVFMIVVAFMVMFIPISAMAEITVKLTKLNVKTYARGEVSTPLGETLFETASDAETDYFADPFMPFTSGHNSTTINLNTPDWNNGIYNEKTLYYQTWGGPGYSTSMISMISYNDVYSWTGDATGEGSGLIQSVFNLRIENEDPFPLDPAMPVMVDATIIGMGSYWLDKDIAGYFEYVITDDMGNKIFSFSINDIPDYWGDKVEMVQLETGRDYTIYTYLTSERCMNGNGLHSDLQIDIQN